MNTNQNTLSYSNLSIIVATDQQNGIGKNNQLLWHLPNDLKFFKKVTSGNTIIMGRKTYESIGKPLPNRRNVVISRNQDLKIEGVEIFDNISSAIQACVNEEEVFIIGGGEIYKQALDLTSKIYLTKVEANCDADIFFPEFKQEEWETISEEDYEKDDRHAFNYTFSILKRI
jgi:dihydrofolate reductase